MNCKGTLHSQNSLKIKEGHCDALFDFHLNGTANPSTEFFCSAHLTCHEEFTKHQEIEKVMRRKQHSALILERGRIDTLEQPTPNLNPIISSS